MHKTYAHELTSFMLDQLSFLTFYWDVDFATSVYYVEYKLHFEENVYKGSQILKTKEDITLFAQEPNLWVTKAEVWPKSAAIGFQ